MARPPNIRKRLAVPIPLLRVDTRLTGSIRTLLYYQIPDYCQPLPQFLVIWKESLLISDKVSYRTLHNWIVKNYGKTNRCEICDGRKAKMFDWHNLSGNYKRERDDWQMLCRSCHMKIDGRTERFGNFLRTVGKGR